MGFEAICFPRRSLLGWSERNPSIGEWVESSMYQKGWDIRSQYSPAQALLVESVNPKESLVESWVLEEDVGR